MVQYLSVFLDFMRWIRPVWGGLVNTPDTLYNLHFRSFPFEIFPTRSPFAFACGQVIPPPAFMTYPESPAYTTVQCLWPITVLPPQPPPHRRKSSPDPPAVWTRNARLPTHHPARPHSRHAAWKPIVDGPSGYFFILLSTSQNDG